jgi:molybdenum cofactor biosynthesis protein B
MIAKNHNRSSRTKVPCAVITVSDTRNKATDKSGKLMIDLLTGSNHQVIAYHIIPDVKQVIQQTIKTVIYNKDIKAVIVTGGTGISQRDVTIESIQPLFDKELPGFGELFRLLSYQLDIGSASMLSRAIAGVANNRIIFSTPGSIGAVKLAMDKLILPELGHAVMEINKDLE